MSRLFLVGRESGGWVRPFARPHPVAFALAVTGLALAAQSAAPARPIVITGARFVDVVAGRYVAAAAIVIEGDTIRNVYARPPASLPADATLLDLPGVTLIPGLGDMHAAAAPSAEVDADYYASLALAHGVTMVRAVDVRLPWAAAQRERVRSGLVLAPRMWTSGPALDQAPPSRLSVRVVTDAAAAAREVAAQASAGVDWIAVEANTKAEVYQAILTAARAAHLRVGGRAVATSMAQLARLGVDAVDLLECPARTRDEYAQLLGPLDAASRERPLIESIWRRLPAADGPAATAQLVRSKTVLVPALAGFVEDLTPDDVVKDPALALLPAARREALTAAVKDTASAAARGAAWKARAGFVKNLVAAGGLVATGSDTEGSGFGVPGASILKELVLLVRAGLTPAQALRAATVTSAALMGASASLGQIRPGYQADLFGVEGDPLREIGDVGRIRLIIRSGEILDREALLKQGQRGIIVRK